jgi:hypothetical protein
MLVFGHLFVRWFCRPGTGRRGQEGERDQLRESARRRSNRHGAVLVTVGNLPAASSVHRGAAPSAGL